MSRPTAALQLSEHRLAHARAPCRTPRVKRSHRLLVSCSSSRTNAAVTSAVTQHTEIGYERLKDPARIGATGKSSCKVQDLGGEVSLTRYMTLPIEQYFVLDPSQIKFLGGDRFQLAVPRIHLFNVWLEPEVEVSVSSNHSSGIILKAENCRIKGSELVMNMKLDERFCMVFVTELTWRTDAAAAGTMNGEILGTAQLDVWSEVVPPFNLMPRNMLEGTCNVVMGGLVSTLLPLFVRKLAADYGKWATDAAYRAERAARSAPMQ